MDATKTNTLKPVKSQMFLSLSLHVFDSYTLGSMKYEKLDTEGVKSCLCW